MSRAIAAHQVTMGVYPLSGTHSEKNELRITLNQKLVKTANLEIGDALEYHITKTRLSLRFIEKPAADAKNIVRVRTSGSTLSIGIPYSKFAGRLDRRAGERVNFTVDKDGWFSIKLPADLLKTAKGFGLAGVNTEEDASTEKGFHSGVIGITKPNGQDNSATGLAAQAAG